MKKFTLLSAVLAAMIVPLLPAKPAQAVEFRTFVSSTGGGTACTRAAPCGSFAAALDATVPGGDINCLDSGFFGGANITKSITIDCAGTAAWTFGFSIDGAGIVVRIRNMSINGVSGDGGIAFTNGATLFVENCLIQKTTAASGGSGIKFAPSAAGSQLVVTDTILTNNGTGLTGGGIIIQPTGSGTIDVVLDRVRVENNVTGIRVDGSGSTGVIQATIRDSVVSGNKTGSGVTAVTTAGGAVTTVFIDRTALVSNGTGVLSNGAAAAVLLNNSTIQANGVALSSAAGGALFSYKNNSINNNGTPGAAPTVVAQN